MFLPTDRSVQFPNRYQLAPVAGTDNIADLTPAPGEVSDPGTLWNRQAARQMQADLRTLPIAPGYSVSAGDVVDVDESGNVLGLVHTVQRPLSSFSEGSIIQIIENGSPVDFYVAKHDYESGLNGAGRTLVVRKDCYDNRVWDNGNVNAYASSDLDSWFNSTYKNMLDADIRSLIGTTKIRYTPGNGNWTVGTLERAVFALSATELGQSASWLNVEGSALPIASTLQVAHLNGSAITQWTRSPHTGGTDSAVCLNPYGSVSGSSCTNTGGFRPAFTLPETFNVIIYESTLRTQAIALQSGTTGQSIECIFSGTTNAAWATEGQVIDSPGVYGVGIMDGILQVWSKERPGQVVTGSYVGTGTYGESNPNKIAVPSKPKAAIVGWSNTQFSIFLFETDRASFGGQSNYSQIFSYNGQEIEWYTTYDSADYQLNQSGNLYAYVIIL